MTLSELYGDISERVISVIESMVPALEVYSIDKSKFDSTGIQTICCRLWTLSGALWET